MGIFNNRGIFNGLFDFDITPVEKEPSIIDKVEMLFTDVEEEGIPVLLKNMVRFFAPLKANISRQRN